MPLILIYDTETTGLPDWKAPSEAPSQPHLCELAAGLFDQETGEKVDSFCVIIKPDGWVIPPEMTAIHGISQEMAERDGIPEPMALGMFHAFWLRSVLRAAHNETFDARIMRIAYKRFQPHLADVFKDGEADCTAQMSRSFVQAPPSEKMMSVGMKMYKTPSLTECVAHFFGEDHADAHGGEADMLACARVYFHVRPLVAAAEPKPDAPKRGARRIIADVELKPVGATKIDVVATPGTDDDVMSL